MCGRPITLSFGHSKNVTLSIQIRVECPPFAESGWAHQTRSRGLITQRLISESGQVECGKGGAGREKQCLFLPHVKEPDHLTTVCGAHQRIIFPRNNALKPRVFRAL